MTSSSEKKSGRPAPPPLSRNPLSYLGWLVCCVIFMLLAVLVVTDVLFHSTETYKSIITYMLLPPFLGVGVAMVFAGIFLEWRRRHKALPGKYPRLPVIDMNVSWQRRRLTIGMLFMSLVFGLSSVVVYQAYHFTESPRFCGEICHVVMEPEYTAYQHSPHSRVACTECHIGPGAEWFVKAKVSGLKQVWDVATGSYHLPISVPVENLRPAQSTCEQCHWPEKFFNSIEKSIWHFSPDQSNTPARYKLLLKIGGGATDQGMGRGIHWHSTPGVEVRYWARDRKRSDIPWVEVKVGDGEAQVYRTEDCPDTLPEDAEIRRMDCIDCHNRPAHIYNSPRQIIDSALGAGLLERSLPYFKRYATELFERKYASKAAALETISKTFEEKYAKRMAGPAGRELVEKNITLLQDLYSRNFFPDHKVDWREYPNRIGHFEFNGCNRCHDGKHNLEKASGAAVGAGLQAIDNRCETCHDLVDQAEGEAVYAPSDYRRRDFQHPRRLGDIWKDHECTECHGLLSGQPSSILSKDAGWWVKTSAGSTTTTASTDSQSGGAEGK